MCRTRPGDSITVIGWVEEAVLAQTPGGLDGNTLRGLDAPGREGKEAEDGIGVVQVWKQGRLNRAGEGPEGLIGADERDMGFSLPEVGVQGIGVFPEAATDDDGSRRQFARSAIEREEAGVGEEELVGEVGEGMVGGSIVGDGGRGAEVGTDVGSEGRGAGDTILEREDREEVAEGAGEEEEAGDGGDGEETPATAGEEKNTKPTAATTEATTRASGVVPNRKA